MKRALIATGAALTTGLALLFACGPGDLRDLTRGFPPTEAGDDGGLPPIPRCRGAVPDGPPAKTASAVELPEIVFAFDNIRIDSKTPSDATLSPAESINLDDNCSCDTDFSCDPPDGGDRKALCDDKDGRDNVGGKLLGDVSIVVPTFRPTSLKQRIDDGAFSVLISLLAWNGEPNDDRVFVGVRTATGIDNGIDGGLPVRPLHNGNDAWSVDPGSLVNAPGPVGTPCTAETCLPLTLDPNAYVVNGKLVAHWPSVNIGFSTGTGTISLPYLAVTLVADLTSTMVDGQPVRRLDGQLAGRWPANALLAAAGAFSQETSSQFQDLCKNDIAFNLFRDQVCASADLAADPKNDNTRGIRCGALSEAIRFTAVTARLGATRVPAPTEGDCRREAVCPP